MVSVPRRAKRLESVISIFLLGVLFLTGAAIFVKQSNYDMGRFGIGTTALPKQETTLKFGDIVPAGFEALSEPEVYDSETLYEKIDGKAPLYLESGFEELSTQRFVSKSNPDLWMELYIYDMGDIRNAFSVYSVQKRPRPRAEISKDLSLRFAYRTLNALYFVLDKYYVEIIGSAESNELFNAIVETQEKLTTNLAVNRVADIAELATFPGGENLVRDSFKLYTVSAFGFEGLTDVFTAKYKFDGESVIAFLSKRDNPKEAEQMAESYRSFLIENGAAVKNTDNELLRGKILDLYGTTEIVFTVGSFLAGVHEAEDQQAAEKLAEMLINRLNNE